MIHVQNLQPIQHVKPMETNTVLSNSNKEITVNVLNQLGEEVSSYTMSGMAFQPIGNSLHNQQDVIQVLVNGNPVSMAQAKSMTFGQAGSEITIMENQGMSVNASYNINGNNYVLGNTSDDVVTANGAKIYVPTNVLKNNKLSSVEINGTNYEGTIEGNYVVVKGNIPEISAQANNVSVRFHNDNVVPGEGVTPSSTGKANVEAIVMNQYGQMLSDKTYNDVNGFGLLPVFQESFGPVQSIQYNGTDVTLMDVLTQQYTPGTSNILNITVHTASPITMSANMFGNILNLPTNNDDSITDSGATFTIPSGLAGHFDISSVDINGTEYSGKMVDGKYTIKAFIPTQPNYQVKVNLARK